MVELSLPLRVVSESNSHDHWWGRRNRSKRARRMVHLLWPRHVSLPEFPLVVTLTRVAPRELDDDNIRGALKACRDQVAEELGLPSDRDPRVRWEYGQEKGRVKQYAVRIRLEATP